MQETALIAWAAWFLRWRFVYGWLTAPVSYGTMNSTCRVVEGIQASLAILCAIWSLLLAQNFPTHRACLNKLELEEGGRQETACKPSMRCSVPSQPCERSHCSASTPASTSRTCVSAQLFSPSFVILSECFLISSIGGTNSTGRRGKREHISLLPTTLNNEA